MAPETSEAEAQRTLRPLIRTNNPLEQIAMANMHNTAEERNTLVAPAGEAGTPVAYKGVPVMTTERLAESLAATAKQLGDNYTNNESRYVEGVHVFKVTGHELRALKNQPEFFGLVDKRAAHLLLWTERGAYRHAKSLNTAAAWGAYELFEDYEDWRTDAVSWTDQAAQEAESAKVRAIRERNRNWTPEAPR